jgi:hypothetical protein
VQFEGLATGESKTDAFGHVQLAQRGVGDALSRLIEAETGFETRVTVLGHPSAEARPRRSTGSGPPGSAFAPPTSCSRRGAA